MDFHFRNDQPIYLQLVEQIRAQILSGKLGPGEKLPSVRELAKEAKVNPNTVQKALGQLESEGLIETRRTSGKFVSLQKSLAEKALMENAREKCRQFAEEMKGLSLDEKQILALLEEVLYGR